MPSILIMPGMSHKNVEWAVELKKFLKDTSENISITSYNHWQDSSEFNFDKEVKKMIQYKGERYIIIAKSIGTIICIRAIKKKLLNPAHCIFLGTAISWAKGEGYPVDTWFNEVSTPVEYLQNEFDPAISSAELSEFLNNNNCSNYSLKCLPGDSHEYSDYNLISLELTSLLNYFQSNLKDYSAID